MSRLTLKTKVFSGENYTTQFDYLPYKKILIVTDKIMSKIGLYNVLITQFKKHNIQYHIFDDVEPNPSFETVTNGVTELINFLPDAVIALGGGSVIDATKGVLYYGKEVYAKLDQPYWKPTFIAIPTTSGAGSEVTSYAVITDTQKQLKIPIVSDDIIPNIAILDPLMTKSCPPKITAESGIDVLTHALESYVATDSNMFTEALAEKVCSIVFQELITVVENGENLKARLAMHEASCMAGLAFTNSGLGLNHAMSHSLGGYFHIPHGRSNALLMPHIIRFNQISSSHKYQQISSLLGFPAQTPEEGVTSLLVGIEYLCEKIHLERKVTDFGVSQEKYLSAIPQMAHSAYHDPCLITNPIKPTIQEIESIYRLIV
ncbi:MAG: 1-propanol dehydrogenase PduQ [Brevinema sp.]